MTNYSFKTLSQSDRAFKYQVLADGQVMTNIEVLQAFETHIHFRQTYSNLLADCPFASIFWECAPMARSNQNEYFEFILLDCPAVGQLNPFDAAFREKFNESEDPLVAVFKNLGRNATLVAPKPLDPSDDFAHLLNFVRTGTAEQIDHFWLKVGETMLEVLNEHPIWLSTSGLGVYWLHVRLDSRPKYYQYLPYREWNI
ncbi:MAG: hypothetical protein AAFV80_04205 [Bacteroidota bacterium]